MRIDFAPVAASDANVYEAALAYAERSDDNLERNVFDPAARGTADPFVLRVRKPD
ncbi:MAG: hypothetical protein AAF417_13720 [Pseudomonadota bacterium]